MRNLGILNDPNIQQPFLLDAIRHAETGHLSPAKAAVATSKVGARGAYQFMPKNLHSMGYKMPDNIPLSDVLDPTKARGLAGQYVTGYSNYHGFTTPLQKLAAYNMGPQATENWLARGGKFEDLPDETQKYVTRAAKFMENKMALPKNSIAVGLDTSVAARRAELTEQLRAARVPESAIPQMVAEMLAAETVPQPALSELPTTGALAEAAGTTLGAGDNDAILKIGLDNAARQQGGAATVLRAEDNLNVTNPEGDVFDEGQRSMETIDVDDPAVRRRIGLGQPPQPVGNLPPQMMNAPNVGLGNMMQPDGVLADADLAYERAQTNAPNVGLGNMMQPNAALSDADLRYEPAGQYNAPNIGMPKIRSNAALADDDLAFEQGLLSSGANTQYPIDHSSAILNPDPPAPITGALSTENQSILRNAQAASAAKASEGRRNATGLTTLPTASIDGSDLIRIGSAMVGGSATGGLNAIDRAGQEYGAIMDAKGTAALEKYKADLDAAQKKQVKDNNAAQVSSRIVTSTIDDIMPIINDDIDGLFNKVTGMGGNTTGFFGKIMSGIGGTEANDLRTMLDTVRANVGFDKLQSMREASPTGGALGNVSNQENLLLQSVLSNVEQSQSPEQLKRNLLRLRESYLDIVHGIGNRPYGTPKFSGSLGGSQMMHGVKVTKVTS